MNLHTNWNAYKTLATREVVRFLRIWSQTLLPSPISISLYFIIFGGLIGSRVGQMDGVAYVDYIAPGLIMMAIINNSFSNTVASVFGAKFARNIEEMLVSPMSVHTIILGFVTGGVLRGLLISVVVMAVAMGFTQLNIHHLGVIVLVAILTACLFSLLGALNGLFAKKFDEINILPTFILTPLTYLGGIFFSIKMLPPLWQGIAHLNPIFYMVNAFRYGMLGVSDVNVTHCLLFIGGCVILLYFACYILFIKGIGLKS